MTDRLILTLVLIGFLLSPVATQALSEGPLSAGTGTNDASYGDTAWSAPGNILANDGIVASSTTFVSYTQYLVATNFGFSIPGGSTIDGVVFESENTDQGGNPNVQDRIYLVKGGVISNAVNRASGNWDSGGGYITFGSSSDLWGVTLTDSDVNASNFGLAQTAFRPGSGFPAVDHVRATVYYSAAPVPEFSTWALIILVGAGIIVLKKEGYLEKLAPERE